MGYFFKPLGIRHFFPYERPLLATWMLIVPAAYAGDFSNITTQVHIDYLDGRHFDETYQVNSEQQFTHLIDQQILGNPVYNAGAEQPSINARADIQGNIMTITTQSGSNTLKVDAPNLSIHESFAGTSRSDSVKQFETWAKDHAGEIFQKINARSPLSTIGGVSGYVPRTQGMDATIDGSGMDANVLKELAGEERESHLSILTGFSTYNAQGKKADVYSFPINYNWEFSHGWALLLNAPLAYIDTDGVASYSGSIGTGLRIPVSNFVDTGKIKWDLVPLFRIGAIGSEQNNVETSVIYSGGIQSNAAVKLGAGFSLVMQNQYNYFAVTSVTAYTNVRVEGDVVEIPTIANSIFRNGVQLVKDFDYQIFGRTLMADITFADVRLSGTPLAIDNQQEIGFDVGLRTLSKSKFKLDVMDTAKDVLALDKTKLKQRAKDKLAGTEFKIGFKYTQAQGVDNAVGINSAFSF